MYADDTEIDFASKTPCELQNALNEDLAHLQNYFMDNKLSLNTTKCEYLLIGTPQNLEKFSAIAIKIGDDKLQRVNCTKYLGMQIESSLRWSTHIDKMASKIASKIGILRKLKRTIPHDTLLQVYNSMVSPHFDYGDIVYDSCTQEKCNKLQSLQNRAVRLLTGSGPREHRDTMFKKLNWMTLKNRRIEHKCVLLYKSLHNMAPQYLTNQFHSNSQCHAYNTRNSRKLRVDKVKTAYYSRSFRISAVKLYNDLPENISQADTLETFKSQIHNHFLNKVQF